jgi:hypothetical protein
MAPCILFGDSKDPIGPRIYSSVDVVSDFVILDTLAERADGKFQIGLSCPFDPTIRLIMYTVELLDHLGAWVVRLSGHEVGRVAFEILGFQGVDRIRKVSSCFLSVGTP